MIDKKRLLEKAKGYDIENMTEDLTNKLDEYAEFLLEWNKKANLTAIKEPEDIENKHFIDSLIFAAQPEIKGKLVDVGTGAGFPGVVTALYRPELDITLMEPTGKRVEFLKALGSKLGLGYAVVKERAEEAGRKAWRESYDVACARAVAALPALAEYCLPLVKVGGLFIAMKGSGDEEAAQANNAIEKLGGKLRELRRFELPDGSKRMLILIEKIKSTEKQYPRNGGVIAKRPL